ncbi:MAG: ABC transporter substrate-binding protein [Comamonas sp.]|jgi:iron complex transport system substrate-binding protein|nr:ABC transporter substrate-binding protein [Comamonas sp.]
MPQEPVVMQATGLNRRCAPVLLTAALLAACGKAPEPQAIAVPARQHQPPLNLSVCGQNVRYDHIPRRAVTHDVNITESFLYLGLGRRLVGYSGIPSSKEISPQLKPWLQRLPDLSSQGMNLEVLLGAEADFVFGGWSYGFRQGAVTPERLASHGIASYVLSESCIRVQKRERIALDDALLDMENISRIFGVLQQTQPRIDRLRASQSRLRQQMKGNRTLPRVFVYDSGQEIPVTVGHFGMPQAMLEEAGATNIFSDLTQNWQRGNWEDVIERDPEWIVIIDYGQPDALGKIEFLLQKKELEAVSAIRNRRFFVMSYAEATPGPRNIEAAQRLAAALHPERKISVQRVEFSAGELP